MSVTTPGHNREHAICDNADTSLQMSNTNSIAFCDAHNACANNDNDDAACDTTRLHHHHNGQDFDVSFEHETAGDISANILSHFASDVSGGSRIETSDSGVSEDEYIDVESE